MIYIIPMANNGQYSIKNFKGLVFIRLRVSIYKDNLGYLNYACE